MKKSNHIEEKILDRIIKVAYGDGNFFERISVKIRAKNNPEIQKLLHEYSLTAGLLYEMSDEKCPDELPVKVSKKIEKGNHSWLFTDKLFDVLIRKPVISAAAVVLIAGVISVYISKQHRAVPDYSKQQVVLAEKQVKETLALVDKVFQNTRKTLENDVLKKQVSPPINEGINVINNLFKGG